MIAEADFFVIIGFFALQKTVMIFPDFSQFSELATLGNFIPVYQEWVADLDTPVSAWYKVCAEQL